MNAGALYNTEDAGSRQERVDVRARASREALSRGDSGCAMSPVEMTRAMAGLLRMHQSEFEMQVHTTYSSIFILFLFFTAGVVTSSSTLQFVVRGNLKDE